MTVSRDDVLAALRRISLPDGGDLVSRDMIRALGIENGVVRFVIEAPSADLARKMEPRAASPARRLAAMAELSRLGIPTAVLAAPMIPGLNDAELEQILLAGANAGARRAGYVLLRLPLEIRALFEEWMARHFPDRARKVLSLIRQTRGGATYQSDFGTRQTGTGPYAELLQQRFLRAVTALGMERRMGGVASLDCEQFAVPEVARPQPRQMALF